MEIESYSVNFPLIIDPKPIDIFKATQVQVLDAV